jgi:hypothetical protein
MYRGGACARVEKERENARGRERQRDRETERVRNVAICVPRVH